MLLARLTGDDTRAVWATACCFGLRRGELMALRWSHIGLNRQIIHVQRSWDDNVGEIPQSKAGHRRVPVVDLLADVLKRQQMRTDRSGADLVLGRTATLPFSKMGNYARSRTAWKDVDDPPTV